MLNIEQELENLNSYIQKLRKIVSFDCSFTFGNTKIVNKSRIDDVICCIQASYPKDYKEYVKRNGTKSLETYLFFQKMLSVATNKWFLSSNFYAINYAELETSIQIFMNTAKKEIRKIEKDNHFQL